MGEQHSAEWHTLMEAWRQVQSLQQAGHVAPEAWQAWRAAVAAWRKAVDESVKTVQARRNELEDRRRA